MAGNSIAELNNQWNALENASSIEKTFVQNNVTNTAQTLEELGVNTGQSNFQGIRIGVHTGDIRVTDDGTDPDSSTGLLLKPGIYWFSRLEARGLKIVAAAGNVECSFQPQTFVG